MKTIITGLLSKAYNQDNGKIAELLKDLKDGEQLSQEQEESLLRQILDLDANRIKNIRENVEKEIGTAKFQEGFKKDKKELFEKFEKELKEKFGIESDKTGQDLVDFIVSEKSEKGGQGGEVTEDAIKRSKLYQDLESKARKDVADLKTTYDKQIEDINKGHNYEKTYSDVTQKAMTVFNGLNPILPQNKAVADNQVNNFVNSLKGFKFEKQDDRIVVMDSEGKVVQDGHGNSRSFEDIIKEQASGLFEFKANNGGSGSGNGNGGQGGEGGSGSHTTPKTFDELEKVMGDASISIEDRSNIMAEYEKAQKGI